MIGLSGPTLSSVHFRPALLAKLLIFGGVVFGHRQDSAVTLITVVAQAIGRRRGELVGDRRATTCVAGCLITTLPTSSR
jgi:hypothetical protein